MVKIAPHIPAQFLLASLGRYILCRALHAPDHLVYVVLVYIIFEAFLVLFWFLKSLIEVIIGIEQPPMALEDSLDDTHQILFRGLPVLFETVLRFGVAVNGVYAIMVMILLLENLLTDLFFLFFLGILPGYPVVLVGAEIFINFMCEKRWGGKRLVFGNGFPDTKEGRTSGLLGHFLLTVQVIHLTLFTVDGADIGVYFAIFLYLLLIVFDKPLSGKFWKIFFCKLPIFLVTRLMLALSCLLGFVGILGLPVRGVLLEVYSDLVFGGFLLAKPGTLGMGLAFGRFIDVAAGMPGGEH